MSRLAFSADPPGGAPQPGAAYPTKPIRVIVQFAPGGQGDMIARSVATKASESFKQTVLVDNRTGGGGTIAADALVKSNPDGYTFMVNSSSYAANAALYSKRAFDPVNHITPVLLIGAQIRAGRLRGVAVTSAKRMGAAPEYPPVGETVPGYEAVVWYGVAGPKGIPQAIVTRWNNEVNRILQLPDVKERMAGDGMELAGGPPQHFRDMLVADIVRWQRVVKMANIKVSK